MSATKLFIPKSIAKSSGTVSMEVLDSWSKGYGVGHSTFDRGIQTPPVGSYGFFYFMAKYEAAFRTCNEILKSYHFREGLEWTNQAKYEDETKILNKLFHHINGNKQSLIEVSKEIESDLNIADDAYICFSKDYVIDKKSGDIIYANVQEIFRGNPQFYRFVTSDNTRIGRVYGRCLVCEATQLKRNKHYRYEAVKKPYQVAHSHQVVFQYTEEIYDFEADRYVCPYCQAKLHDVEFVVTSDANTEDAVFYHIEGECYHYSKYNTSRMYGLSPIITIANHMDIRIKLIQYLQTFLEYRRVPEGAIFINTGNPKQVKQMLEQAQKKYMQDRYYQPIIAVDAEKSGGNFIQYIKFTPLPEELKMHEQMSDLKREISALLGVQNVMLNDLEGVGGMNSESLQVQVTDRAAKAGQVTYNDKVYPDILHELGRYGQYNIPDDLKLTVKRTDNAENESRLHNLNSQMLITAAITDLGYEAEPDFINLVGPSGYKLLPFTFRKLSPAEIREQLELGEIDTDPAPESVQTSSRPQLPGIRRKIFGELDKNGMFCKSIDTVRYSDGTIKYKLLTSPYEFEYVTKEVYDQVTGARKNFLNMEKEAIETEKNKRLSKWYYTTINKSKRIMITALRMAKKNNPLLNSTELIEKSVKLLQTLK